MAHVELGEAQGPKLWNRNADWARKNKLGGDPNAVDGKSFWARLLPDDFRD